MILQATDGSSMIERITFYTGANIIQYSLPDRVAALNEGMSIVCNLIIRADGRMGWDDPNFSDQPVSVQPLVANQQDYNIFASAPSSIQDWLMIDRIDILDNAGNGINLIPIDQRDLRGIAMNEYENVPSIPSEFDMNGTQIFLYPAPSYNMSGGLIAYFKRAPYYFSPTYTGSGLTAFLNDATKRPGFATTLHKFLPIYASYVWGLSKSVSKCINLKSELGDWEDIGHETGMAKSIMNLYSRRNKYEVNKITRGDRFRRGLMK